MSYYETVNIMRLNQVQSSLIDLKTWAISVLTVTLL